MGQLNKETQKKFILQADLWQVMLQLSWPAVIAMVLYGLNAVVSAMFVGRFVGEAALAGVSVVFPLTQISIAFGSLIGVGAGSVLSIAIGAGDHKLQERILGNVNTFSFVAAIVYIALGLAFSSQLVRFMGGAGQVLLLGDLYFRITILGAFFWIYGLAANMIVRAEGKMKAAAVMMGVGLMVDILANYLFVVVMGWGLEGSAWAANVGMFVYTMLGWLYFDRGLSSFHTRTFVFYWDNKTIVSVFRLGMPACIMIVMNLIQGLVVFNALARYGTVLDIAFYGIVYRLFTFALMPVAGLMRALQPVVGINYGARQYGRVIGSYYVFTAASMALTVPMWLLCMAAPASVLSLMLPGQLFAANELMYFRIYMVILPLLAIIFMAMTFFPGIDKGKPAAVVGIARQLIFYIPAMLILPRLLGVAGIYIGSAVIDVVIVIWTLILIRKEFAVLRGSRRSMPVLPSKT